MAEFACISVAASEKFTVKYESETHSPTYVDNHGIAAVSCRTEAELSESDKT
jgi:hypothetical protein